MERSTLRSSPWLGTSVLVVMGALLAAAPALARVAPAVAPTEDDAPSDLDLMDQADAKRQDGAHAEAASLYARAYRARPEAERADALGEVIVRAALVDYQLALEQDPDDVALLRAQAELFQEFLLARKPDPSTQDIAELLAKLDARLQALEQAQRAAEEAPLEDEQTRAQVGEEEPEPASEPVAVGVGSRPPVERAAPAKRPSAKTLDVVLLSVGATSTAGGLALIAGSTAMFYARRKAANAGVDRFNAIVAELEDMPRTPEQEQSDADAIARYIEDTNAYRQANRARAIALSVTGSILAAAGIGVSTWAILRMRRHRRQPSNRASLSPVLGRRHAGVHLAVSF